MIAFLAQSAEVAEVAENVDWPTAFQNGIYAICFAAVIIVFMWLFYKAMFDDLF